MLMWRLWSVSDDYSSCTVLLSALEILQTTPGYVLQRKCVSPDPPRERAAIPTKYQTIFSSNTSVIFVEIARIIQIEDRVRCSEELSRIGSNSNRTLYKIPLQNTSGIWAHASIPTHHTPSPTLIAQMLPLCLQSP